MTAADTIFDLHLPDCRRFSISAEVVPHVVGHTATYDASDTVLDALRHMNAEFLPTKTVKPDILIGTKHLYKIGFVAERQCLRSGFTVVNTDLGPVVTGHGNMITNLKPVDSCNLVIHDAEFEADYRKHMQLDIIGITPPSKEESKQKSTSDSSKT
ncbi:hypothetical protein AAVH_17718 [Aphelenchoides avenae]|nr:hypothetical protein AAVH_17718 [Aphelenchus avenae]